VFQEPKLLSHILAYHDIMTDEASVSKFASQSTWNARNLGCKYPQISEFAGSAHPEIGTLQIAKLHNYLQ
jgi:hypothetical protein